MILLEGTAFILNWKREAGYLFDPFLCPALHISPNLVLLIFSPCLIIVSFRLVPSPLISYLLNPSTHWKSPPRSQKWTYWSTKLISHLLSFPLYSSPLLLLNSFLPVSQHSSNLALFLIFCAFARCFLFQHEVWLLTDMSMLPRWFKIKCSRCCWCHFLLGVVCLMDSLIAGTFPEIMTVALALLA